VNVAVYFVQILKIFAQVMVNLSALGMRPTSLSCECSCILCPNFENFCPSNGQFVSVGDATASPASPSRTLMTDSRIHNFFMWASVTDQRKFVHCTHVGSLFNQPKILKAFLPD